MNNTKVKNMDLLREVHMICEDEWKNALRMKDAQDIAKIMYDAGVALDYENFAHYGNLPQGELERLMRWSNSAKRSEKLGFQIGAQAEPKGDFAKLMLGLLYIKKHREPGIQNVARESGLDEERIRELVNGHRDEIKQVFNTFGDHWIRDTRDAARLNAKRQYPEEKKQLIRQAVEDISKGRPGTVTATQIQNWNKGAVGLDRRQIDNYLSNDPDLRDLERFRVIGKIHQMTDAERAARHERELRK